MAAISRDEVANLARLARITMTHPLAVNNVTREDLVLPSLTPTEALSGAPASDEGRFKVPQILGEE
ncbi:MAG: aspartyl/glutamyl-tRNA amidotransferase subunit C [Actinobacteria bacterium]|nr:aspartyl/glutamyl-tRNA amidotransferase subunit C [Actinomycetota bacterium]